MTKLNIFFLKKKKGKKLQRSECNLWAEASHTRKAYRFGLLCLWLAKQNLGSAFGPTRVSAITIFCNGFQGAAEFDMCRAIFGAIFKIA